MPDHRKPPHVKGGRHEAPPPSDAGEFSIESTTMRLKSVRLRRAEKEKQDAARLTDDKTDTTSRHSLDRPAGRVRHDERGQAVWDWAEKTGEHSKLSTTRALKKLEVADLKLEETQREPKLTLEKSGRDKGGGGDPYNQRGSGKRQGEAAERQGITGSKDRDRRAVLEQLVGKKK